MVILAMLTMAPSFARADGEPDESFATVGAVAVEVGDVMDAARGMAIQPNGRIVVVGDSPDPQGAREIVVAREMTKQFEEIVRGPAARLKAHFETSPVRGEFTVIIPS